MGLSVIFIFRPSYMKMSLIFDQFVFVEGVIPRERELLVCVVDDTVFFEESFSLLSAAESVTLLITIIITKRGSNRFIIFSSVFVLHKQYTPKNIKNQYFALKNDKELAIHLFMLNVSYK